MVWLKKNEENPLEPQPPILIAHVIFDFKELVLIVKQSSVFSALVSVVSPFVSIGPNQVSGAGTQIAELRKTGKH